MKKTWLGTIFFALAVVFAVAGTVIYCINSTGSYYDDFTGRIVLVAVVGIALLIGLKIMSYKNVSLLWTDVLYVASAVIIAVAAVMFLSARVESAAVVLGSQLAAGDALAKQSVYTAFAGIGCYMAGMVFIGISGFFNQEKKEENE